MTFLIWLFTSYLIVSCTSDSKVASAGNENQPKIKKSGKPNELGASQTLGSLPIDTSFLVNGLADITFCDDRPAEQNSPCELDNNNQFALFNQPDQQKATYVIDGEDNEWSNNTLVSDDIQEDYDKIAFNATAMPSYDLKSFNLAQDEDNIYLLLRFFAPPTADTFTRGRFVINYGIFQPGSMIPEESLITFFDWKTDQKADLVYYSVEAEVFNPLSIQENSNKSSIALGEVVEIKLHKSLFSNLLPLEKTPWQANPYFFKVRTLLKEDEKELPFDEISGYRSDNTVNYTCSSPQKAQKSTGQLNQITIHTHVNQTIPEKTLAPQLHQNAYQAFNFVLNFLDLDFTRGHDIHMHVVDTQNFVGVNRGDLGLEFSYPQIEQSSTYYDHLVFSVLAHEFSHYFNWLFAIKWLKEGHSQLMETEAIRARFGIKAAFEHHQKILQPLYDLEQKYGANAFSIWSTGENLSPELIDYFYRKAYFFTHYLNYGFAQQGIIFDFITKNQTGLAGAIDEKIFLQQLLDSYKIDLDSLKPGWLETGSYLTEITPHLAQDSDHDGLLDIDERINQTDPLNPDSDNDQLLDGWELSHCLNPTEIMSTNSEKTDTEKVGITLDGYLGDWDFFIGKQNYFLDPATDTEAIDCPPSSDIINSYAFINDHYLCAIIKTDQPISTKDTAIHQFSFSIITQDINVDPNAFLQLSYVYPNRNFTLFDARLEKDIQKTRVTYTKSNEIEFCVDTTTILDSLQTKSIRNILVQPSTYYSKNKEDWSSCDITDDFYRPLILEP